jgi:hypothetical protein
MNPHPASNLTLPQERMYRPVYTTPTKLVQEEPQIVKAFLETRKDLTSAIRAYNVLSIQVLRGSEGQWQANNEQLEAGHWKTARYPKSH